MFWRHRKVLQDRAAGMVFDWRSGHGSARRLLVAGVVAISIWGALLAYVQISEPAAATVVAAPIDLTLVDLDAEENRWLGEQIDRETLFHRRWNVDDPSALTAATAAALAEQSPRIYQPTLREIPTPAERVTLATLPGMGPDSLPPPQAVPSIAFASPPANWWVEVRVIDGPATLAPFSFKWPDPDPERGLSQGEIWTVLLGVDWRGKVVVNEPTIKSSNVRTPVILKKYRALTFLPLPKKSPLRWWKLEARVVNRPPPE